MVLMNPRSCADKTSLRESSSYTRINTLFCLKGWSAVTQSRLTAASVPQVPEILLPQPLGSQDYRRTPPLYLASFKNFL